MTKKKITMVFDTETAGTLEKPLIYDIGLVITDKKGSHLLKKRWIVKEIFDNKDLMDSAYYSEKIPKYYNDIDDIKAPFGYIIHEIREIIQNAKVDVVAAYNLNFDLRAMVNTYMELIGKKFNKKMIWSKTKNDKFYPNFEKMFTDYIIKKETKLLDIWSYACETVLNSRNYRKVADINGWYSEAGNYLSNAEKTYAYLSGDHYFEEEHTALDDSMIEVYILWHCEKRKKAHKSGILFNPWRLIQK